jgi:hypothetical protein
VNPVKFSIHMSGWLFAALERAHTEQTRSRSAQIAHYVKQGLKRDGYLPSTETEGA